MKKNNNKYYNKEYLQSFVRRKAKGFDSKDIALINDMKGYIVDKTNIIKHIDLWSLYSNRYMEIGFGSGEHFFDLCTNINNIGNNSCFIGCETYLNGISGIFKKINFFLLEDGLRLEEGLFPKSKELNLPIHIWKDDARDLLNILPNNFLKRVYILCPDPWPKNKHYKRRLINNYMLQLLFEKLGEGGDVIITTDHVKYASWIEEIINLNKHIFNSIKLILHNEYECDLYNVKTKYALKALNIGNSINYFKLIKN